MFPRLLEHDRQTRTATSEQDHAMQQANPPVVSRINAIRLKP
jgi:hypothetical protein